MKILLCHNHYQLPGGEDEVFADEAALLESHGHQVIRFTLHNDDIERMNRISVAMKAIWNRDVYGRVRRLIRRERPDLMHCTNSFPLISPAAASAARIENVPVVQSLHNYRMMCANSLLMRDGRVCDACVAKTVPWNAVIHGCYRGSRIGSAVVASMIGVHRAMKTWQKSVTFFVTPTRFARARFIEAGLPAERIGVKPNFVSRDTGTDDGGGGYALFVGRLSEEKGIETLLDAWQRQPAAPKLVIVGDGPLAERVRRAAALDSRIEWRGRVPSHEVGEVMGRATCVVLPSICYETFGRTIIEAYMKGTPVVASNLGAMAELVRPGETGFLAAPGDAESLAAAVRRFDQMPSADYARLRAAARQEFEEKYTAERNYGMLLAMYSRLVNASSPAQRLTSAEQAAC